MNQYTLEDATAASQIWGILILAARYEKTITYKELGVVVNKYWRTPLSRSLDPIKYYCKNRKLPVLTILVVKQGTRKPSTGLDDTVNTKDVDKETRKVFDWVKKHWKDFEGALKNPGVETFKNP